jgi:hypothetical protein
MKWCNVCKAWKEKSCFAKDKKAKDGLSYRCKECGKNNAHQWYKNNPEKVKETRQLYYAEHKQEIADKASLWVKNNKGKRFIIHRKWYEANKDEKKVKDHLRYVEKKEHIMELCRLNRKRRISEDPKYKLSLSMSRSINNSIHHGKNKRKWEALVGYTKEELTTHLEKQFKKDMTWENYGEWHIDHIIPRSVFNYTLPDDLDFKRCWSLKNLRPMWADDNIRKGAKLCKPFQPSLALAVGQ